MSPTAARWSAIIAQPPLVRTPRSAGPSSGAYGAGFPGKSQGIHATRTFFVAAFREGFAQLEPCERDLLRMHHLDGATATSSAGAYRVHAATAARWMVRARERLEAAAARRLNDQDDVAALLGLVRSRLDASLRTLLTSKRGETSSHQPS